MDFQLLFFNKCSNRSIQHGKEKQRLTALISQYRFCESSFYFWEQCMNTYLATKEFLEEAAEQDENKGSYLALNRLSLRTIHLSSSAGEVIMLIHFLGHIVSALWLWFLIYLDIHPPVLQWWQVLKKSKNILVTCQKKTKITYMKPMKNKIVTVICNISKCHWQEEEQAKC